MYKSALWPGGIWAYACCGITLEKSGCLSLWKDVVRKRFLSVPSPCSLYVCRVSCKKCCVMSDGSLSEEPQGTTSAIAPQFAWRVDCLASITQRVCSFKILCS